MATLRFDEPPRTLAQSRSRDRSRAETIVQGARELPLAAE